MFAFQWGKRNLINAKSYGFLKIPSIELLNLISVIENSTMKVLSTQKLWYTIGYHYRFRTSKYFTINWMYKPPENLHNGTFKLLFNGKNALCKKENIIDTDKARQHKKLSWLWMDGCRMRFVVPGRCLIGLVSYWLLNALTKIAKTWYLSILY